MLFTQGGVQSSNRGQMRVTRPDTISTTCHFSICLAITSCIENSALRLVNRRCPFRVETRSCRSGVTLIAFVHTPLLRACVSACLLDSNHRHHRLADCRWTSSSWPDVEHIDKSDFYSLRRVGGFEIPDNQTTNRI